MCSILSVFSLQNAVCFIMLTCLVSVLFTFYIQSVLKLKKKNYSGAKGLILFSCAVAWWVSRRHLIAGAPVPTRDNPRQICGGQESTGADSSQSTSIPRCRHCSTISKHQTSSANCCHQKGLTREVLGHSK